MPSSLSRVERLQLVNQFEILEKLDPDHARFYAEKREILERGYTVLYEQVFQGIFSEEMSMNECNYVFDVLDMHRDLINGYEGLEDKAGLTPEDVAFRGFDGNNESQRYGFVLHLREAGKWQESLSKGSLNSHTQSTIHRYPPMLERWKKFRDQLRENPGARWELTADQIKEIIDWKAQRATA
jgi:uncharacterized protein